MSDTAPWAELAELNVEIGQREFKRDSAFFEALLAPAFAMHRADPKRTVVDRKRFLQDLGTGSPKQRTTEIDSISLIGQERFVVTCVVTMDQIRFHNLRVFVLNRNRQTDTDPKWLLLAWANEPVPSAQ